MGMRKPFRSLGRSEISHSYRPQAPSWYLYLAPVRMGWDCMGAGEDGVAVEDGVGPGCSLGWQVRIEWVAGCR